MKNNNLKPKEKRRGNAKSQIPSFLLKLYQILEVKIQIIGRIKNMRR